MGVHLFCLRLEASPSASDFKNYFLLIKEVLQDCTFSTGVHIGSVYVRKHRLVPAMFKMFFNKRDFAGLRFFSRKKQGLGKYVA